MATEHLDTIEEIYNFEFENQVENKRPSGVSALNCNEKRGLAVVVGPLYSIEHIHRTS